MAEYLAPLIGDPADRVARLLIERFGTIARVMGASREALYATLADFPDAFRAICSMRELMDKAHREELIGQAVSAADPRLHRYLRAQLQNPYEERMHAVYLNRDSQFLAGETIACGSAGVLRLRMRHVIHRALDLNSSGLLLSHNHPSGSSRPSPEDAVATKILTDIATAVEVEIIDHLIVGHRTIFSMKTGREM